MAIKSNTLDPVEIGYSITDEMIDFIEVSVKHLANNSQNPYAFTLNHNLEASKSYDLKRRAIVDMHINCLQMLSFIQLGRNNELPIEDFTLEVHKMFTIQKKGVNGNGRT